MIAYVIKSESQNKYLGFDSRFIIDRDTVHGATFFKTKEEAEKTIEYFEKRKLEEGMFSYNPLDWCKPLIILKFSINQEDGA